jgi:hypothetical protein
MEHTETEKRFTTLQYGACGRSGGGENPLPFPMEGGKGLQPGGLCDKIIYKLI